MNCSRCGKEIEGGVRFCPYCGSSVAPTRDFIIVTTPTIPGYRISKVLGIVTGLTPRTRGILGRFVAGLESIMGGEVTAFTTELEKARDEAIDRARQKAIALGANAIVGLDMETSDLGLQVGIVVICATGTAVLVQPE